MFGGVATIAALGDMVRQAGDDDTGKAGHWEPPVRAGGA